MPVRTQGRMADAQNLTADAMATQLKALYGSGLKPGFPHEPGVLLVLSDTGRQALDALPDSPAIVLDTVAGNDSCLRLFILSSTRSVTFVG